MVSNERVFSLDWAPDAIIVTDLDGSMLHINPRAEDLFGYRKDELIDKPLELLIPEGLWSAALESSPLQHVSRIVVCAHRDGTRFRGTARWRPAPAGRDEFVVFSIRDLDGGDEPDGRSGEPASDEDGQVGLLALFAHDVRESLQAVQYVCDALRERAPAEAGTVGEIVGSVGRLLERVTAFSNAKAIEPRVEPCRLGDLLGTLGRELRPLAERKGLRLSIAGVEDVVVTDPVLLRELLHNLLTNAIRYTDSGRVDVRCGADPAHVRVEIVDTGAGIGRERLAAMRAAEADRSGSGASEAAAAPDLAESRGLGLAIVHQLARLLDCTLEVDSAPGRGSRFAVIVPRSLDGRCGPLRLGDS